MNNYYIENKQPRAYKDLYYKEAYPNKIINNFFSAIRLTDLHKTGYAQIFSISDDWASGYKEKLPNTHGVSVREFPTEFELDRFWLLDKLPKIELDTLNKIKNIFKKIINNKHKKVEIALNSCLLRESEEDTVLDATIALEVLLSDDGKQEMTHKLSLRISALSLLDEGGNEQPIDIFKKVKKVYEYRSSIVHGNLNNSKSKKIVLPNKVELKTVEVAIDLLKMVLRVLINNDQYLEPTLIDQQLLLGKRN